MMGPTLSTFAWGCGEQEKEEEVQEIQLKTDTEQETSPSDTVTDQIETQESESEARSVAKVEASCPILPDQPGDTQPGSDISSKAIESETDPSWQGHLEEGTKTADQESKAQSNVQSTSLDQELPLDCIPSGEILTEVVLEEIISESTTSMATEAIPPLDTAVPEKNSASEEVLRSSESPEPDTSSVPASSSSSADTQKDDDDSSSPRSNAADESGGGAAAASESKEEQNGKASAVKPKKKEDKSIEYILRALSSLSTPEEKLAALCKKYADLHEEHRVLQSSFKQQQRRMTVVTREKDQLQAEHTKAVIAKSKLESLCRELQKHNKLIKEESLQRAKEEDEKRKEISAKFQATIGEIQTQMTENHEKNVKLREENADLAGKLKKFIEQYEVREQQLEKLMKHRELEQQLADAKLQKAAAVLKEEQERNIKEKEILVLQATEGVKKNTVLEAQLTMYKDRYEEFQATINKSNDMFQKLKGEMDRMGKRIKKLEKEGAQWRAKWETSNKALLDMAEEKTRTDKEKLTLQTKIQKLESLCRALQAELHGKKSSSPQPLPPEECAGESPRESVLVTSTPPNTPENTSRASPDSTSGPPALGDQLAGVTPPKQNGPLTASSVSVEPDTTSSPSAEAPQVSLDPSNTDQAASNTPAAEGGSGESPVKNPCEDISDDEEEDTVVSSSEAPESSESVEEKPSNAQTADASSAGDPAV